MTLYDDKTLVAYVDGELDPREAWLVQIALERDPNLRDKVRVMRETSALLRATFDPFAREALPAELDELMTDSSPLVARFGSGLRGHLHRWAFAAVAATLALVAGLSGGYWVGAVRSASVDNADIGHDFSIASNDSGGVLQAALEKKLSGSELTWTDERSLASVTVEPIRTYRNEDATFCREYRETFAQPRHSEKTVFGLACRDDHGKWNIEYYVVPKSGAATQLSFNN